MTPRIQLALDLDNCEKALTVAHELSGYWDILEVGTSLLISEGLSCAKRMRSDFEQATILVDTKIIDNAGLIVKMACEAGADIITVVSAASEKTIELAAKTSHAYGCKILLDHMSNNWEDSEFLEKTNLEVDFIGLHLPKDLQDSSRLGKKKLEKAAKNIRKPLAVAGGIDQEIASEFLECPVEIIVVGSYLIDSAVRRARAEKLKRILSG
jgi:3-hexulose-6-phosphate synthase